VEILPEASLAIRGRTIPDHAAVVSHPTVQEIPAVSGRAEASAQTRDLEPLLQFYADKGGSVQGLNCMRK